MSQIQVGEAPFRSLKPVQLKLKWVLLMWYIVYLEGTRNMLKLLTIGPVCFLHPSIVRNVLSLILLSLEKKSNLLIEVAAVLVHNAVGSSDIFLRRLPLPPITQIPVLVVKATWARYKLICIAPRSPFRRGTTINDRSRDGRTGSWNRSHGPKIRIGTAVLLNWNRFPMFI